MVSRIPWNVVAKYVVVASKTGPLRTLSFKAHTVNHDHCQVDDTLCM